LKRRITALFATLVVLALVLSPAAAAGKKEPRLDPKDFSAFVHKTLAEWKAPASGSPSSRAGRSFSPRDTASGMSRTSWR